jgi:RsmE family RNA methyltransferase
VNLILLQPTELDGDGTVRLADARGAHIATVLNAVPGQHVRIGLVDGPFGTGTVTAVEPSLVSMRCDFEAATPSRPRLDLLLALPRPKVLRRLWSQLAALGVGQVILTNAARVERDYFGAHVVDPAVFTPLLIEGLQQARDTRLPVVSIHRRLKVLVEDDLDALFPGGVRAVAQPGHDDTLARVLAGAGPARALLAVGPEGGWTGFELDLLARHRFRAVGMGPRTLRSDTATIALLTLAHQALDRFSVVSSRFSVKTSPSPETKY